MASVVSMTTGGRSPAAKEASVVVFDMAAVIPIIKPVFGEYTQ